MISTWLYHANTRQRRQENCPPNSNVEWFKVQEETLTSIVEIRIKNIGKMLLQENLHSYTIQLFINFRVRNIKTVISMKIKQIIEIHSEGYFQRLDSPFCSLILTASIRTQEHSGRFSLCPLTRRVANQNQMVIQLDYQLSPNIELLGNSSNNIELSKAQPQVQPVFHIEKQTSIHWERSSTNGIQMRLERRELKTAPKPNLSPC